MLYACQFDQIPSTYYSSLYTKCLQKILSPLFEQVSDIQLKRTQLSSEDPTIIETMDIFLKYILNHCSSTIRTCEMGCILGVSLPFIDLQFVSFCACVLDTTKGND